MASSGQGRNRRARGHGVETAVSTWLQRQGLIQRCRNYHCRFGEIDLVMDDGEALVFVEVRYRGNTRYGDGAASVTRAKQQRLVRTARHYLARHPQLQSRPCRFDVVAAGPAGDEEYHWIRNAFYGE